MFTFIDLFAGIGGFHQALSSLGGRCVGFSEIAPDAIRTYCKNYDETEYLNFGDITTLEALPPHDFMTAGVPCQSWSIAGKNLGFDDDRGQLWNDTLFLLNKSRPKAFIFENVKGLADPRNAEALSYILKRIREAGYFAHKFVINSYDYGVAQNRVRIYLIGFKEKIFYDNFKLPATQTEKIRLRDVIDGCDRHRSPRKKVKSNGWSLSRNANGFNDYFLFNDLRNGHSTIHSWDICPTTTRQKHICMMILGNRRKKTYGPLDGNPLSLSQLKSLDPQITQQDIDSLIEMDILKRIEYRHKIHPNAVNLTEEQKTVLSLRSSDGTINVDEVKTNRLLKLKKIVLSDILDDLKEAGILECVEIRYDFKNTKISTGLNGINRIFLPSSDIFPTLVASDSNDFVTTIDIDADSTEDFKTKFLEEVYFPRKYRKITKEEACRIQGFPSDFDLPESRARWMKLIGNSVSVPVIRSLVSAVIQTGVFNAGEMPMEAAKPCGSHMSARRHSNIGQLSLFEFDDLHTMNDSSPT